MTKSKEILFAVLLLVIYLICISLLFNFWHNQNCYLTLETGAKILNDFCSDSIGLVFLGLLILPFLVTIFAVYKKIPVDRTELKLSGK